MLLPGTEIKPEFFETPRGFKHVHVRTYLLFDFFLSLTLSIYSNLS
ncbi:MAG: hypothetical protein ACP5IE_09925 [Infirmifilum sp.]